MMVVRILLTICTQAYELSVLTGTQVLLLVVSETGLVYTFTTPKLQPLVTKAEGKNLIQVGLYFRLQRAATCTDAPLISRFAPSSGPFVLCSDIALDPLDSFPFLLSADKCCDYNLFALGVALSH